MTPEQLAAEIASAKENQKAKRLDNIISMMNTGTYFNVCLISSFCQTTGQTSSDFDQKTMSELHCVDWTSMSPELRNELRTIVARTINTPRFTGNPIDVRANDKLPKLLT